MEQFAVYFDRIANRILVRFAGGVHAVSSIEIRVPVKNDQTVRVGFVLLGEGCVEIENQKAVIR